MNIFLPDIMDNQLKSGIHLLHNFGCKINMSFCLFLKEIFDQFYVLQVIYICKWGRVETKQFEDEKTILWVERTQHKTDMMLTLFFNELNIFDWHRVFSFLFFLSKKVTLYMSIVSQYSGQIAQNSSKPCAYQASGSPRPTAELL